MTGTVEYLDITDLRARYKDKPDRFAAVEKNGPISRNIFPEICVQKYMSGRTFVEIDIRRTSGNLFLEIYV